MRVVALVDVTVLIANMSRIDLRLVKNLHMKLISKNVIGLYNPIEGHHFAFISKKDYFYLKKRNFEKISGMNDLVKEKFLVPANFSEEKYFDNIKKNLDNNLHLMYLLLTQACNLSCKYCFEKAGNTDFKLDKRFMGYDVANAAIDYFMKNSVGEKKIFFYGGEPTLNKNVLIKSIQKIRKIDKKVKLILITNGTLIGEKLAKFLKKKDVSVSVSIDGPKSIHNLFRVNSLEEGSYDSGVRGYNILKKEGVDVSISSTIGKHNVNKLEEVANFYASKLTPRAVGFNFLISQVGNKNKFGCSIKVSTKKLFSAFKILKEKGIYEDRVMRRLGDITSNKVYAKDCAAYGNQIVVRYDGSVGPCHAFSTTGEYFKGDIRNKNYKKDQKIFGYWENRIPFNFKGCIGCPFISICGGGCAYNAKSIKGSLYSKDNQMCIHSRLLIDWILGELWKQKSKQ